MIKVLLWDIDGTILNFKAAERKAIKKCFEVFGYPELTDETVNIYSAINTRWWGMLERREKTKPEILTGRFEEFFSMLGIETGRVGEFNLEYQKRLGDYIVFSENALETVSALRGRVLQCAVTNGTKTAQDKKLKESGLINIFDHIFISDVVGAEKPSSEFFNAVFRGIDIEKNEIGKDEILIIGDSLSSDIKGGTDAGILCCWYNPDRKENSTELKPAYEIGNIAEVPELIGLTVPKLTSGL